MATVKKLEYSEPEAFVTVRRRDDFTFELIEVRRGVHKILFADVFPIVMDKGIDWMQREAGIL